MTVDDGALRFAFEELYAASAAHPMRTAVCATRGGRVGASRCDSWIRPEAVGIGFDTVLGSIGGEPVLVPGSMGAPSWILVGTGSALSCSSACHGAGRSVPRGKARRVDDDAFDEFLERFRIVTPLDIRRPDVVGRHDIIGRWRQQLAEEAPWAYKDVGPVVETLEDADVARRVVELAPIATIKA